MPLGQIFGGSTTAQAPGDGSAPRSGGGVPWWAFLAPVGGLEGLKMRREQERDEALLEEKKLSLQLQRDLLKGQEADREIKRKYYEAQQHKTLAALAAQQQEQAFFTAYLRRQGLVLPGDPAPSTPGPAPAAQPLPSPPGSVPEDGSPLQALPVPPETAVAPDTPAPPLADDPEADGTAAAPLAMPTMVATAPRTREAAQGEHTVLRARAKQLQDELTQVNALALVSPKFKGLSERYQAELNSVYTRLKVLEDVAMGGTSDADVTAGGLFGRPFALLDAPQKAAVKAKMQQDKLSLSQQQGAAGAERAARIANDRHLTLDETRELGVPFGTRMSEVKGTGKVPPPTEGKGQALNFGIRAKEADTLATEIEADTPEVASLLQKGASSVPLIGNYLTPERLQQYNQAKVNFIMAVLRKESGAAIAPGEIALEEKRYFPQPGDSAKTIQQKAETRKDAIRGLELLGGREIPARPKAATPPKDPAPPGGKGKAGGGFKILKIEPVP